MRVLQKETLEKEISGALKSAIDTHGPIDLNLIPSALKRIIGQLTAVVNQPSEILPAERELLCQRCNREYPVWLTSNELWNQVQREGEHFFCPTCFAVLAEERDVIPTAWIVRPENEEDKALQHELATLRTENKRLNDLINVPYTSVWLEAVPLEAAHQIERWGNPHDEGKDPTDWMWLLGYLAGKAVNAAIAGDLEKAKHHTISCGAVLLNWHRRLSGNETTFRPGIDPHEVTVAPNER